MGIATVISLQPDTKCETATVGNVWRIVGTFLNRDPITCRLVEVSPPLVYAVVKFPDGTEATYVTTQPSPSLHPGLYYADIPLPMAGQYLVRLIGEGGGYDASECVSFSVEDECFPYTIYDLSFSSVLASSPGYSTSPITSGIVLAASPAIPLGYAFVEINGFVRLANTAGLALVAAPSGVVVSDTAANGRALLATTGIVRAEITGLGTGVASAVGFDVNGKLVRAADPTCVPGWYMGDCDTYGNLTIRIRATPVASDAQLRAWSQTDWYLADDGDDNAVGDSPSRKIRTLGQYIARTGNTRDARVVVTIRPYNDRPESDPLLQTINVGPLGGFDIEPANLTVLRQGVMNYRAPNVGTRTPPGFTDTLGQSLAGFEGKLFRITQGPTVGANGAWVAKVEATSTARLSFPMSAVDYIASAFTPSNGQTYEIVEPRNLCVGVELFGVETATGLRPTSAFRYIRFQGGPFTGSSGFYAAPKEFVRHYWCDFPLVEFLSGGYLNGCSFPGVLFVSRYGIVSYYCMFKETFVSSEGPLGFGGTTLVQGITTIDTGQFRPGNAFNFHSSSGGIAIFDNTSAFVDLDQGAEATLHGAYWGDNNTGPAWRIATGRLRNHLTAYNYGTTSPYDFIVRGRTALEARDPATLLWNLATRSLTYPNLVAPYASGGFGGFALDPWTGDGVVGE